MPVDGDYRITVVSQPTGLTCSINEGQGLAVGAKGAGLRTPSGSTGPEFEAGEVYVYTRTAGAWTEQARLKGRYTDRADRFGYSVALSTDGNILAIGAMKDGSNAAGINGDETNNAMGNAGAVFIFTRQGTAWTQQAYIKPSHPGAADYFGSSVALSADGTTLAVGSYLEDSGSPGVNGNPADNSVLNSGAAWVFIRSGATWSQQAYLKASNTGANDRFGNRVALSADGKTLAVGAWGEDSAAKGVGGTEDDNSATNSGAAYLFTFSGGSWSQKAYVKASNTRNEIAYFGTGIALSGDGLTLAVSAPEESSKTPGVNGPRNDMSAPKAGAVYLY